jgi:hypothetical protein
VSSEVVAVPLAAADIARHRTDRSEVAALRHQILVLRALARRAEVWARPV